MEILKKTISLDKEIYEKYITKYMNRKKLRSLSVAIEQAFIELYDED
jgi:hypothetical protein